MFSNFMNQMYSNRLHFLPMLTSYIKDMTTVLSLWLLRQYTTGRGFLRGWSYSPCDERSCDWRDSAGGIGAHVLAAESICCTDEFNKVPSHYIHPVQYSVVTRVALYKK